MGERVKSRREDVNFRLHLWTLYENHFLLKPCVDAVCDTVLGGGVEVLNGVAPLSAEARGTFGAALLQFSKEVLVSFLVQGFVVYTIAPSDSERVSIPLVVPPDAYAVTQEYDERCRVRLVPDVHEGFTAVKVLRLHAHGHFTHRGVCVSPVGSTVKYCHYLEHLEKHDIEVQRIHANPPVLTTTKTDSAFDSRDMLSGAVPGLRAETEHENMAMRNKITFMQHTEHKNLVDYLNRTRVDTSGGAWAGYVEEPGDAEGYVPRLVPLPNDATVASFTLPSELKTINESRKQVCELIATSMGVPLLALSSLGGGAHNTRNVENNTSTLVRTSRALATSLRVVLRDVSSICLATPSLNLVVEFPSLVTADPRTDVM